MESKVSKFQKAKVGLDVGNGYCNFFDANGEGKKFKTTVLQIENADLIQPSAEVHVVEVFNKIFAVGSDAGSYVETQNITERITSEEYKVALLTALALSLDYDASHAYTVDVCVGLPFNLRNSFQEKLIEEIKSITANSKDESIEFKVDNKHYQIKFNEVKVFFEGLRNSFQEKLIEEIKSITANSKDESIEFKVDNKHYQIKFNEVKVFFEGAEAVIKHKKYSEMNLLIDLGSGTTDYLLSKGKQPIVGGTVYSAMNEVLKNVHAEKQKLGQNIKREYVIKYINDEDVAHVVAESVKKIYKEVAELVTAEYMNLVDEIVFVGGGAIGTEKHLKELVTDKKCTIVEDAQFSNVTIYQAYIER